MMMMMMMMMMIVTWLLRNLTGLSCGSCSACFPSFCPLEVRLNGGKRQPSANVDFARKVKMELGSQTLNDAGSHSS